MDEQKQSRAAEPQASALTHSITAQLQTMLSGPPSMQNLERSLRLLAKWRATLIGNTLKRQLPGTVDHGPFGGMIYSGEASEGSFSARLLGVYEYGLTPIFEEIIARDYPLVIDIGCADGYYAVGLARRMPKARILAHDVDSRALEHCAALAKANAVADRISLGGLFTHTDFRLTRNQRTVVICDIEGAEEQLLDPALAPDMLSADILVEVHECFRPGLVDLLRQRFAATHDIRRIDRALDPTPMPQAMQGWSDLDRLLALWEWRQGETPWLWMTRKTQGTDGA